MGDNPCPICYDPLELDKTKTKTKTNGGKELIKLQCGHEFHYDCILYAYKAKNKRKCPYCRRNGGYIELKEGVFPVKNIHYEFNDINEFIIKNDHIKLNELCSKYYDNTKCNSIILNGINKGTQCKKNKQTNNSYCYIHNKFKKI